MPIREHPDRGTVLICNFDAGFKTPEMIKRRPVVVLSPKISRRPGLCTVVALSTTEPQPRMPYHVQIDLPDLPGKWESKGIWVKGDMINAVGFHRLDLFRLGKNRNGKRTYLYEPVNDEDFKKTCRADMHGIGLSGLTKYL